MKFLVVCVIFCLGSGELSAQYPPPAGEIGTTAIPADSSIFTGWATAVELERGNMDVQQPELGLVSYGTADNAISMADSLAVSLGDGGIATLSFEYPLYDGDGWDFAVFENSFDGLFLELAFVEVSSDGEHFFRFPNASLTQTEEPVGSFGLLDARKINNLAGKYVIGNGTPFDLAELREIEGLDIMHITHIRVIDVVGTLQDDWSSFDTEGRKINDPYPTAFSSGGFDLDAVGVMHWNIENSLKEANVFEGQLFPNPVNEGQLLTISSPKEIKAINIYDIHGRQMTTSVIRPEKGKWQVSGLKSGIWLVFIQVKEGGFWQKIVVN